MLPLLRYQSAQSLQVPVLLHCLLRLFLLRNYFAFGRQHITLMPPLVLVFCFDCRLLKVGIVVVFVFVLLSGLGRSEWRNSIKILVVSESHQHRVLVHLGYRLLRKLCFWNANFCKWSLVNLFEHFYHLSSLNKFLILVNTLDT